MSEKKRKNAAERFVEAVEQLNDCAAELEEMGVVFNVDFKPRRTDEVEDLLEIRALQYTEYYPASSTEEED